MALRYEIHPSIRVARVGNSPKSFYLAPEAIGVLPIECDEHGSPGDVPKPVTRFRDEQGCIRRQAARFRVFVYDDSNPSDPGREITLDDREVLEIKWTVHLANKKAARYPFSVFLGDVMLGPNNTYKDHNVAPRNADGTGAQARQKLESSSNLGEVEFSQLDLLIGGRRKP